MLITCSVDMMLVVSQNSGGCPFHCVELSQDWKCSEDPGRPGADFWKLVELRMGRKINWIVQNSKMNPCVHTIRIVLDCSCCTNEMDLIDD